MIILMTGLSGDKSMHAAQMSSSQQDIKLVKLSHANRAVYPIVDHH